MKLEAYPVITFPDSSLSWVNKDHYTWSDEEAEEFIGWFRAYAQERLQHFRTFLTAAASIEPEVPMDAIRFVVGLLNGAPIFREKRETDGRTVLSLQGKALCTDLYLHLLSIVSARYPNRFSIGLYRRKVTDIYYNSPCIFLDGQATEFAILYKSNGLGLNTVTQSNFDEEDQLDAWLDEMRQWEVAALKK